MSFAVGRGAMQLSQLAVVAVVTPAPGWSQRSNTAPRRPHCAHLHCVPSPCLPLGDLLVGKMPLALLFLVLQPQTCPEC